MGNELRRDPISFLFVICDCGAVCLSRKQFHKKLSAFIQFRGKKRACGDNALFLCDCGACSWLHVHIHEDFAHAHIYLCKCVCVSACAYVKCYNCPLRSPTAKILRFVVSVDML